MFGVIVSLLLSYMIGLLLVRAFLPFGNHPLTWLLAPGFGLGLTSATMFLTLILADRPDRTTLLMLDTLLLALAVVLFIRFRSPVSPFAITNWQATLPSRFVKLCFYGSLTLAGILYLVLAFTNPHGNWDAWAIWNVRARFLVRGDWMHSFSADVNPVHSDYPLLISASVARCWIYGNTETTVAPALIAASFTFAVVGLLYTSIRLFSSTELAMLAVVVLVISPRFILVGVAQYADIPLSYFILTTLLLTYLRPHFPASRNKLLIMAGLAASMAAWTKNEGALFLAVLVGGRFLMSLRWRRLVEWQREMVHLGVGIAPIFAAVLYFKLQVAPENYLVAEQGTSTLDRVVDITRYITIAGFYTTQMGWFVLFGFPLIGLLLLKYARQGTQPVSQHQHFEVTAGMGTLGLQFLGYTAIYIVTPKVLYWQLGASLPRLLLHLWPTFLLTVSLVVLYRPATKMRATR